MIIDIRAALITGRALVTAGVLSDVLFPGTALTVLAGHRGEVPR